MANFITGGPVPLNHPSYVKRTTQWDRTVEDELLQILQSEQDVTIVGPRQIGKSSMVGWLSTNLRERGFATAYIDMTRLMNQNLTEAEWIRGFCERLVDSLRSQLHHSFAEPPPDLALGLKTYFGRLTQFLKNKAIVICIDEANSVPSDLLSPFYSNIRAIINERRIDDKTDVDSVQFVFAGVFDPNELIKDKNSSPFNTTHLEILRDFNRSECRQLLDLIGLDNKFDISENMVEAVFHWTQGNPFITQLFASAINDAVKNKDVTFDANLVDHIMPTVEDSAASNLDYIRDETLKYLDNPSKRDFMREILQGKRKAFQRSTRITNLSLIGAVKRSAENWIEIRNPMVAAILSDELLGEYDPEPSVRSGWNPSYRGELNSIILAAYDISAFKNMLFIALGQELLNIAPDSDFPSMLVEVIKKAEKEGWIVELVLACQKDRPSNLRLQKFIAQNQLA